MKTLMVGELEKNFSKALEIIEQGEEITIRSDNKKANIAVLIPFDKYTCTQKKRKLGILESKASFTLKQDFKITDEEVAYLASNQ